MTTATRREEMIALMQTGQERLCAAFAAMDGQTTFQSKTWERPGGGGGTARVLSEGAVFERAGVNVSAVHGDVVPPSVSNERPSTRGQPYFATGISMVLHTRNPYAPAFHANFRYFEAGDEYWFGGGMDMTPSYGFADDARHFHRTLKALCDRHAIVDYAQLKTTCDKYFYLKHRSEMRGVGGIFFDNLQPEGVAGFEQGLAFQADGIRAIEEAYLPIVARRKDMPYGEHERQWQLYRRGRYVEFNLVYDRGTLFGLQTSGNIEAILMSLPPLVRWEFDYHPEPGSPEAATLSMLQPYDWAGSA
ncbi:oxygen-dependent coproporphyrinogen oxidase [Candidatus Gracilibacteria bacterium]|nr:oxygen-dependent coproporphyrinogen oxidase [Candidatus Gracilibacteria bacterium]